MMAGNPNGPTPLAIRGRRDPVRVAFDILNWVKTSSGRENNDGETFREQADLTRQWEALRGDAVLFVERNDDMGLHVTVLTAQQ